MGRIMSSVKISDKEQLDRLAASILLKTGRKFTQQELLSFCVQFSNEHLDEFLGQITKENRKWSQEEIDALDKEFVSDLGEGTETLSADVDKILYGE